jgi:hypothetical protein
MDRETLFLHYALSHPLGSPRRLLGTAIEDAFNTDLAVLSTTHPGRAALFAVARFEYEVKKGGFAQLLFNMRNQGVEVLGHALVYAGAKEAAQAYGAALALCRQDPAGYHGFLASDFRSPNAFKDTLHSVSLPYLRGTPIEVETAPLIDQFVVLSAHVCALAELDGRSLAFVFKEEFARGGNVRKPLLDAIAHYLRAHTPAMLGAAPCEFFDGLSGPPMGVARLADQLVGGDPAHAIVLGIMLRWASSEDERLIPWLEWALSLPPAYAVEVLDFLRAGVAEALQSPDTRIREAITRIPAPWSWTSEERASALEDAEGEERAEVESFG